MRISLFRILGNDLPPRHEEGQTLRNLKYMLENEPDFDDVEKIWIVNRIIDPDYEAEIIEALGDRRKYVISFDQDIYSQQNTFEDKYHYITNVNAARNMCLDIGFNEKCDIVMPFDGNCFFTLEGWYYTRNDIANNFLSPYFMVPMARCKSYDDLTAPPMTKELYTIGRMKRHDETEPQVAFGRDHDVRFNTSFKYSEASKVELLWKLAIPGVWDYFYPKMHAEAMNNPSIHVDKNPIRAGYVFRLPSGNQQAETCNAVRGRDRMEGLKNLVEQADLMRV